MKMSQRSRYKTIICINDGKIYETIGLASNYYNISSSGLGKSLRENRPMKNGLRFKRGS